MVDNRDLMGRLCRLLSAAPENLLDKVNILVGGKPGARIQGPKSSGAKPPHSDKIIARCAFCGEELVWRPGTYFRCHLTKLTLENGREVNIYRHLKCANGPITEAMAERAIRSLTP